MTIKENKPAKSIQEKIGYNELRNFDCSEFSKWDSKDHKLVISVTDDDFSPVNWKYEKENKSAPKDLMEDLIKFIIAKSEIIERGYIEVRASRTEFDLIELTNCIDEGYDGDDDGFGIEPATWIVACMNFSGQIIAPFSVPGSRLYRSMSNFSVAGINPIDFDGKTKTCPYDLVEEPLTSSDYFHVCKDGKWGIADKNLNTVINLEYKMINIDFNGLIWVRLENNLCGILSWENKFVIPPEYTSLLYIEDGDLKGCYQATKGDLSGIINLENKFIPH